MDGIAAWQIAVGLLSLVGGGAWAVVAMILRRIDAVATNAERDLSRAADEAKATGKSLWGAVAHIKEDYVRRDDLQTHLDRLDGQMGQMITKVDEMKSCLVRLTTKLGADR